MLDPSVTAKIIDMTNQQTFAYQQNVYRETMRQLLHIFGNMYYIDGNNNKIKVKCVNGRQEKPIGRQFSDNTAVLPMISVTEVGTSNSESRRRYNPVLVSEASWDDTKLRAIRLLSLPPRPVDLFYQVNIWTKYQADMDILRYSIFSLFNPDLSVETKFSDYTKAFIDSEEESGTQDASDTTDRILKKTINIRVETYLPSPKFLYTSTKQIEVFNQEYQLFNQSDDFNTDDPIETEEVRQILI